MRAAGEAREMESTISIQLLSRSTATSATATCCSSLILFGWTKVAQHEASDDARPKVYCSCLCWIEAEVEAVEEEEDEGELEKRRTREKRWCPNLTGLISARPLVTKPSPFIHSTWVIHSIWLTKAMHWRLVQTYTRQIIIWMNRSQ